ncbi:hypothetical protein HYT55_01115 [Candidatus Woesearchaeota archaeon]|nr:hypothetical protein [Candidatus Woesearchaeota archaeon]
MASPEVQNQIPLDDETSGIEDIYNEDETQNENHYDTNQGGYDPESRGCKGSGTVNFTVSPRRIEDIGFFAPMGLMLGDHVTPIDHGYFYPPHWKMDVTSAELKDVYVPADGVVTLIARMPSYFTTTKEADLQDYRIIIHHTCTFYTIYIHLNTLAPRLKEVVEDIQPSDNKYVQIEVKAGELLGRANAFDFSVHNKDVLLSGFSTPSNYESESWKIHTVDLFDYVVEPVRSQILAKNPRTAEPRGGKIDYDMDGKLIGSWFLEGTEGYAGVRTQPNYWVGHLAFAPDAYDPSYFTVSIGQFGERSSKQYGAKGNSPDPATVDASSGIIKYELVEFEYVDNTGKTWDTHSYASGIKVRHIDEQKRGIILVQLLENKKLKVEIFPDKTPAQVTGFTNNVKRYYR